MGDLGVTRVHTVRRTNHTSLRQTSKHGGEGRGGFEIGFTEHVREIPLINFAVTPTTRQKIPNHSTRTVSTSSLEWPVALVGYAVSATVVGASVAVHGTHTAGHSGHDF